MICTSCRAPHYGPRSLVTGLCEACERIYRATPPAPVPECPVRDTDDADRLWAARMMDAARHGPAAVLSLVKHFRADVSREVLDAETDGTCPGCDGVSPFHTPDRCRAWTGEERV